MQGFQNSLHVITNNKRLSTLSVNVFCALVANIHAYHGLQVSIGYASVNSSSAHPPPPGNPGAFPNVARPGGGAFAYLGLTPGHLTRGFETVE